MAKEYPLTPVHPYLQKTKQLKTSAEEVRSWQVRWEQSNTQLLQVMSESAERGKTVEQLKSKVRAVHDKAAFFGRFENNNNNPPTPALLFIL